MHYTFPIEPQTTLSVSCWHEWEDVLSTFQRQCLKCGLVETELDRQPKTHTIGDITRSTNPFWRSQSLGQVVAEAWERIIKPRPEDILQSAREKMKHYEQDYFSQTKGLTVSQYQAMIGPSKLR